MLRSSCIYPHTFPSPIRKFSPSIRNFHTPITSINNNTLKKTHPQTSQIGGKSFSSISFKPAYKTTNKNFKVNVPPVPPIHLPRYGNSIRKEVAGFFTKPLPIPEYALLYDFNKKENLLGWRIVDDREMNGSSEGTIAWGRATNPITGEEMRTLVFKGTLGVLVVDKRQIQPDTKKISSFLKHIGASKNKEKSFTDKLPEGIKAENIDEEDIDEDVQMIQLEGYCGVLSPPFTPSIDISEWDTYNVCIRTDDGPWFTGLKPAPSSMSNFKTVFTAPVPAENTDVPRSQENMSEKPMRNLFLPITSFGANKNPHGATPQPSNKDGVEGFSLSIRGPPGPFKVEIGWIAFADSAFLRLHNNDLEQEISPDIHAQVRLTPRAAEQIQFMSPAELRKYANKQKSRLDERVRTTLTDYNSSVGLSDRIFDTKTVSMDSLIEKNQEYRLIPNLKLHDEFISSYDSSEVEEQLAALQLLAKEVSGSERPLIAPTFSTGDILFEAEKIRPLSFSDSVFHAATDQVHAGGRAPNIAEIYQMTKPEPQKKSTYPDPGKSGSRMNPEYLKKFNDSVSHRPLVPPSSDKKPNQD